MGYFSELDFMEREEAEYSRATKVEQLTERMVYLSEQFADLVERCPSDMADPDFDGKFYSECLTEADDDTSTVQGVLQTIRKTKELLRIAEEEERQKAEEQQHRLEWRNTVWETGATPDYQIVLLSVFFPAADRSVAA